MDVISYLWGLGSIMRCYQKTSMVHQTFVRWALYILFKIVKSLIRHLGLAIGNVRHVRWYSWTLIMCSFVPHYEDMTWKHFPHYWPFGRGNPLITEGSPSQNDVTLWCFLCCYPEQAVEQTVQWPVFWGGSWCFCDIIMCFPWYGPIFHSLTHWSLGDMGIILKEQFSTSHNEFVFPAVHM